jgi:general secretion pathway protein G
MAEGGLVALVSNPGLKDWKSGGYLEKSTLPKDPWGRDYVYQCPGANGADFDLYSTGPDGQQRLEP